MDIERTQIEDEAIEWLARLRASDVTAAEKADFATWLAQSPQHKAGFDDIAMLWQETSALAARAVPTFPKYRARTPLAFAASIIFGCMLLVLQMASPEFDTSKGEQRRIALTDGSTAFLNTNSRITVNFEQHARNVVIHHGEVWFDVKKDSQRPFLVEGMHATAQAVGTAFTVHETPGFTQIGVTAGTVAVSPSENSAGHIHYLHPGQENTVSAQRNDIVDIDVQSALSWQHGQLVYDNVTLGQLLHDLNRYLPITMTVNDDAMLESRVTAVLRLDDQEAMLDALSQALPIRWKAVSDNLIILIGN